MAVSLAHYRTHGADVLLTCTACMKWRKVPLETVIAELGEAFPITGVGARARRACECGAVAWSSKPAFPHRVGMGPEPR